MSILQPSEKFPVPHTSLPPKWELAFHPPGGFSFYFHSLIQKLLNSSCSHALVLPCSCSLVHSCSHALILSCSPDLHAIMHSCTPAILLTCCRALVLSCCHVSCFHAPMLPFSKPCRCFPYSTRSPLRKISLTTSQSTLPVNKPNIKRIRTYKS